MGCSPEDLPERMDSERGSGISVLMARLDDDNSNLIIIICFAQLYSFKYFYQTQIICTQLYGF